MSRFFSQPMPAEKILTWVGFAIKLVVTAEEQGRSYGSTPLRGSFRKVFGTRPTAVDAACRLLALLTVADRQRLCQGPQAFYTLLGLVYPCILLLCGAPWVEGGGVGGLITRNMSHNDRHYTLSLFEVGSVASTKSS